MGAGGGRASGFGYPSRATQGVVTSVALPLVGHEYVSMPTKLRFVPVGGTNFFAVTVSSGIAAAASAPARRRVTASTVCRRARRPWWTW